MHFYLSTHHFPQSVVFIWEWIFKLIISFPWMEAWEESTVSCTNTVYISSINFHVNEMKEEGMNIRKKSCQFYRRWENFIPPTIFPGYTVADAPRRKTIFPFTVAGMVWTEILFFNCQGFPLQSTTLLPVLTNTRQFIP